MQGSRYSPPSLNVEPHKSTSAFCMVQFGGLVRILVGVGGRAGGCGLNGYSKPSPQNGPENANAR